jgi:hypothetical protein
MRRSVSITVAIDVLARESTRRDRRRRSGVTHASPTRSIALRTRVDVVRQRIDRGRQRRACRQRRNRRVKF